MSHLVLFSNKVRPHLVPSRFNDKSRFKVHVHSFAQQISHKLEYFIPGVAVGLIPNLGR